MHRFLPQPRAGEDYPLTRDSADFFTKSGADLFSSVATSMEAPIPKTSPRRPTPYSYAWQFYHDLKQESSGELYRVARRRLRGLLALLALRGNQGMPIRLCSSPQFLDDANIPIVQMFRSHASKGMLIDRRMIYLSLGGRPIAGLSPLTFLFPVAKAPDLSGLVKPKWFSATQGDWLDPTIAGPQFPGSEESVDGGFLETSRPAIKAWLHGFRDWVSQGGEAQMPRLSEAQLLLDESNGWLEELASEATHGIELSPKPIAIGGPARNEPILNQLASRRPFAETIAGSPDSGLSVMGERFLITREMLANPEKVIRGDIRGTESLAKGWSSAPMSGDHLGAALQLGPYERDALDVPFVFVDKLFLPNICIVATSATRGIGEGWKLPTCTSDAEQEACDVYLYPLKDDALKYFSTQDIETAISVTRNKSIVRVHFEIGDFCFTKLYDETNKGENGVLDLDPSLDFRLFPAYEISKLPDIIRQLPCLEDRRYFTRIRVGAKLLGRPVRPIVEDSNGARIMADNAYVVSEHGTLDKEGRRDGPGVQKRHQINCEGKRLAGFSIDECGLILLRLPEPMQLPQDQLEPRSIGIDFGTSNSCLAWLKSANTEGVLNPLCSSTSLLNSFQPGPRKDSHEGFSALFDFFYVSTQDPSPDDQLYLGSFFPTQLASRSSFQIDGLRSEGPFTPEKALVCYSSVADAYLAAEASVNSLHEFSEGEEAPFPPSIHLKDRLKWHDRDEGYGKLLTRLRRLFHENLRLHLLHSVARKGGYVASIKASFPRAFTRNRQNAYKLELDAIWCNSSGAYKPELDLFTESHAAAAYLNAEKQVDHYLIDIGGGTTDICLFSDGSLQKESSIRFAADSIDRFMLTDFARPLRQRLVSEVKELAGLDSRDMRLVENFLERRFVNSATNDDQFESAVSERAAFYALLSLLRKGGDAPLEHVCSVISADGITEPAIERFLATVTLLFGGLAYFSGHIEREKTGSAGIVDRQIKLSFAGNGTNHVSWLAPVNLGDKDVEAFLKKMFLAGGDFPSHTPVSVDVLPDPKSAVARGLLRTGRSDVGGTGGTVYSGLQGSWFSEAVKNLRDFYGREGELISGWTFERSELKSLASAIGEAIPSGTLGERTISAKPSPAWVTDLIKSHMHGLSAAIGRRLAHCKREFEKDIQRNDPGIALEPLLVAELGGLFEILRSGE